MTQPKPLRIGTRGSPMALVQAGIVRDRLAAAHPELAVPGALEIVVIRTTGDKVQDRTLAEIGGKGLFTKEIEEALLDRLDRPCGAFDEGCRDLAARRARDRLPAAARRSARRLPVAAARSPRRAAAGRRRRHGVAAPPGADPEASARSARRADPRQCRHAHAQARRRRVRRDVAGAVPACSGSSQTDVIASILSVDEMLPAVAQGAIGVECRADGHARPRDLLAPLHRRRDRDLHRSRACAARGARRLVPDADRGAGRARPAARSSLRALVIRPDGTQSHEARRRGPVGDAARSAPMPEPSCAVARGRISSRADGGLSGSEPIARSGAVLQQMQGARRREDRPSRWCLRRGGCRSAARRRAARRGAA